MWPTLNPSLITRRRSSCPMSWETTCCLKMKCPTTLNTTLPTCLSRWTIIIHCRYWRRPQTYQYLQQRLTKLFTGQRDSSIVCGDCMVSVNFIIFSVTTRLTRWLFYRIPNPVGETYDASRRCMEKVLASELRFAPWSFHHKSFRRQLAHTCLRPSRWISNAPLKIFYSNHQRLWKYGFSVFRRCSSLQPQKHTATNRWVMT